MILRHLQLFTLFAIINCEERIRNNSHVGPRIVGGEPTTIESHPYQVSVIYIDIHICGGSLISPRYVLTAAHCTHEISASYLRIRAGSSLVTEGGRVITVSSVESHSQYNPDTMDNDLSILRLSQSLEPTGAISPIQLPNQDIDMGGGIYGIATGWGLLSENGVLPIQLQQVALPTLSREDCRTVYGEDQITDRMICAGYPEGGKDACQGDSGGPFVINNVLVGVTSWGDGCGRISSPGVYTKVSSFLEYINSRINT